MRARNIKPGFYSNEELAECSPYARLLFPGLWMLADREGRLEDRPKKIKAQIFPYDNVDISLLLDELIRHRFIVGYEINGNKYIQILNFAKHQSPHSNEVPSVIPPKEEGLVTKVESTCTQGDKGFLPKEQALRPDSLIPDSLIPESSPSSPSGTPVSPLIDSSLRSESITPPGAATPGGPSGPGPAARPVAALNTRRKPSKPGPPEYPEAFLRFWQVYPRPVDKQRALEVWTRLPASDHERVITAAKNYAAECQRLGKEAEYIRHAKTFLNKGAWEDWAQGPPGAREGGITEAEKRAIVEKYTDEEGLQDGASILRELRALERERGVEQREFG